ncbi:MAG: hypothetical protein EOO68_20155, partial [Moraxellaceae bacterium]
MQRLLLPMSAIACTLSKSVAKQQWMLGCSVLLCSALSHAATPLNDRELNNNFLQNDLSIPTLTLNQIQTPVMASADPKAQLDSIEQRRQLATGVR